MSQTLDALLGVKAPAVDAAASAGPAQSHFITTLFNQLVQTTRQANALPDADEYRFLTTSSPEFVQQSSAVQAQLLNLLGLISDSITHKGEASLGRNGRAGVATSATFSGKKDSLDRFHQLSDTVDTALEAVDLCLDEHRGVKRGNTAMVTGDGGRLPRGNTSQFNSSSTMLKPQRNFAHLIDNSSRAWIPILTSKPNALKPLLNYAKLRQEREEKAAGGKDAMEDEPAAMSAAMTSHIASLGMSTDAKSPAASIFPHPYKYEIENLDYNAVRARQLVQCKEQLYESLTKVPCIWVDSVDLLIEMADALDEVDEIALDLEHHSFRSYLGITCLMQVSTRTCDYLVDTLALRTELHRLNTSFTNPSIVKVLHGSDSDIIWLQRDFGLYIVNLFDTGQAARVLEFQSFGLAYLLGHFCDVNTDKKYQLADWRIRPLSAEMLLYARMDTHYLLYIYDRLKNDLISRSTAAQNQLTSIHGVAAQLATVLDRSKAIALKTYEKEDSNGVNAPMEFAFKMGVILHNDAQSKVLTSLFNLRDELARRDDESVFFMCSNQNLMQIIQAMPTDQQQLEAACNRPTPPMVRMHAQKVLATIAEAKAKGSLTSPFLASTLPKMTGSPTLGAVSVGDSAMVTPQKFTGKNMFAAAAASAHLPPLTMTPATAASALFAQLSTSTPAKSGWVSQALHDAAPSAISQSPVMSTEQLYSSANWIQASKNLERSLAAVKNPASTSAISNGAITIALFDDSLAAEVSRGAPAPKTFQAVMPQARSSTFSMLASIGDSNKESEANLPAMALARAALLAAPVYTHALSANSQPAPVVATPLKSIAAAVEMSHMDVDDDSAMLRTPVTGEPRHSFVSPSPMSLQVIPSPLTVQADEMSDSADANTSGVADASPLPKSMREIYKISNENRRKKKKVKTTGGMPSSMDGEEEDASASTGNTRPIKKGHTYPSNVSTDASTDGTSTFMKNIGWGSGTPPSTAVPTSGNNTQPNSAGSLADKKRKANAAGGLLSSSPPSSSPTGFQSFDYSHATLPPSNPNANAYFNPYTDMGRDKSELKAAAGVTGPVTAANKIYKGIGNLKTASKSVTVRMDDAHQRRGAPTAGATATGRPGQQQQQQQQRR